MPQVKGGTAVFIVQCPRPCGYNIIFPQEQRDMSNFTFHSRYGLITYAQCDGLDPSDVCNHFTSLGAECIIAREDHADGGTHLHVFADFERKRRFRRADIFDVRGYHPNIEPSRGNPGCGWDYATKDGDIVAGGLERPSNGANGSAVHRKDNIMADLVAIEDVDEFWKAVQDLAPGLLLRNFPSLNSYASWRFRPRISEYQTPVGVRFDGPQLPELDEWSSSNIERDHGGGAGGVRVR